MKARALYWWRRVCAFFGHWMRWTTGRGSCRLCGVTIVYGEDRVS